MKIAAYDPIAEAVSLAIEAHNTNRRPMGRSAAKRRSAGMRSETDNNQVAAENLGLMPQPGAPFMTLGDRIQQHLTGIPVVTPVEPVFKTLQQRLEPFLTNNEAAGSTVVQSQEEAPAPEPAARNYEQEAFERFKKGNNPALESGAFTPEYLFELNKKHQAFKLNRQGKTSADLSPENAYLAAYLDARQK